MANTANADLDWEITQQARQETIGKYRAFIDEVYQDISSASERLKIPSTVFNGLEPFRHLSEPTLPAQNASESPSSEWSSPTVASAEQSSVVEHTNYFQLLQTCGNSQLNKLMLVFATLTEEMETLTRSASSFITPLLLYREDLAGAKVAEEDPGAVSEDSGEDEEEDEYTATATILPVLFDLVCYLRRCYEVATSLLLQKHSMLAYATLKTTDKNFQSNLRQVLPDLNSGIRFDVAWTALANLCLALINLDQVFSAQADTLRRDIFNYKRSLEAVSRRLPQFDLQSKEAEIATLLTVLEEVQMELFEGRIAGRPPRTASTDSSSGGNNREAAGTGIDFLFFRGLVIAALNTNVSEGGAIAKNTALNENIAAYIRSSSAEVETAKGNGGFSVDSSTRLLATSALYALYLHLFWAAADRRLARSALTDVQRRLGLTYVSLQGNIALAPDSLLIGCLPNSVASSVVEKKALEAAASSREALLKVGTLEATVRTSSGIITQWLALMEQSLNASGGCFYPSESSVKQDQDLTQLVFGTVKQLKEGVEAISTLSGALHSTIAAHAAANRPLSRSDTVALCKGAVLLKGVQRFLTRHRKALVEAVTGHYQKYSAIALLQILTRTKGRILSSTNGNANSSIYSEQRLDLLSAVILAANCLNGPVLTTKRYTLASLAIAYLTPYGTAVFSAEDLAKTQLLLRRLSTGMDLLPAIRRFLDCSFLYFNRALVQEYFRHFYETSGNNNSNGSSLSGIAELQYFFGALDDVLPLLKSPALQRKQSRSLVSAYTEDVFDRFKTTFLNPLCKDFEDELRYRTHAHLQVGGGSEAAAMGNPFTGSRIKDFASFLAAEPLKLAGGRKVLWIRRHVELHLDALAYNMTAIALHDWKTYESMLAWARHKYGLSAFASLQLPTQTLEQGLDVLEITRNLPVFVAAYLYNLHNQFFVERSSGNKHLNVLTIRHVSNSIQTHGFGVLNSTVNAAYQFLRRKFQTLSAFLFEEHIKSRLIKDIRQFRELVTKQDSTAAGNGNQAQAKFPYERAEKLAKGIRKLGVSGDGQSTYLDRFRQLLTQIGNVLGFVRMLRSGALHCTSEIANFVPDLEDLGAFTFEELLKEEESEEGVSVPFNTATVEAAANFDAALATVATNFSDATDYFRLLVEAFAPALRATKHAHLRNFFVILPATTYNYVQHSIGGKERLARTAKKKLHQQQVEDSTSSNSNSTSAATFTDDGFVMGVVYVLRLLDQLADFDALQWFSSVEEHLRIATAKAKSMAEKASSSTSGVDEKLLQTTSLTIRRLEVQQREYQLLKYGMSSCRILFKSAG